MRSTFMGLETGKRGMFTQQSALYTTGHNISNANTIGYTRQRVNMEATLGWPGSGLNAPKTPGHIGTGVQAHSIQRMRDEFVDRQYRQETNKLGYWESRTQAISQMEDIMSEPSEFGLNQAFNDFWKSMEDVGTRPKDAAARQVAISKAEALADSFNYINTQLTQVKQNLGNEIDVTMSDINSLLKQIAALNDQIQEVEPNGYMPNDLYDQRDVLVDKLNEYIPVTIERVPSGGNALAIAEGSYTIKFNGVELVNGREYAHLTATSDNGTVNGNVDSMPFKSLTISELGFPPDPLNDQGGTFLHDQFETSKGKLLSLIDSYGYENPNDPDNPIGYYPEMLAKLDYLAEQFINEFNTLHAKLYTLDGGPNKPSELGKEFFTGTSASDIKVSDAIISDPSKLAASTDENEEGNGQGALDLANLQFTGINGLDGATFQSFYTALIGRIGVDGQEAENLRYNSQTILLTIENNRASMHSVSLDEEMTNLITFQQAYNANARMITVVDETLDKIINGMGRVGL